MANRITYPIAGSTTRGLTILTGRWAVGTDGAVGAKVCGEGLTLTRTDTGKYAVSFAEKYRYLAAAHVNVFTANAAAQGIAVNLQAYVVANKYVEFWLYDLDTAALTDPVDGELHITLLFANT